MIKKCRICGDEFDAVNPRYCICSDACLLKDHAQNPSIVTRKRLYNRGFDNLMIEEEIASMGLRRQDD